jgi:hypothetical protein
MGRAIAMILIGIVETITRAKKETANRKSYGQSSQNEFEV